MSLVRKFASSASSAVKKVLQSENIVVFGKVNGEYESILTPDALRFVAKLHRRFNTTRLELLARRIGRQVEFDAGRFPAFLKVCCKILNLLL